MGYCCVCVFCTKTCQHISVLVKVRQKWPLFSTGKSHRLLRASQHLLPPNSLNTSIYQKESDAERGNWSCRDNWNTHSIFMWDIPVCGEYKLVQLTLRLLMSYIYIYIELLVKPEMLTSYIYGPTFGNAGTVSFYLLPNVSTLNQCREVSCVTFVCKHFAS